jgi:hypothetical protein
VADMGAPTKRTAYRRQALLKALRNGHGFASAAAAVGVSVTMFKEWRAEDPEFRVECQEAAEHRDDIAEHELYHRGVYKGDTLALLAHLRAHRPERFNRKMMLAVSGDPANPIEHQHDHQHTVGPGVRLVILPSNGRPTMTDEQIAAEREQIARESLLQYEMIEGAAIPPDEADDADDAA